MMLQTSMVLLRVFVMDKYINTQDVNKYTVRSLKYNYITHEFVIQLVHSKKSIPLIVYVQSYSLGLNIMCVPIADIVPFKEGIIIENSAKKDIENRAIALARSLTMSLKGRGTDDCFVFSNV